MFPRLILVFCFSLFAYPINAERITKEALSDYLNSLRTLQANFTQISGDSNLSTGILYIKRPGRVRFEYDEPNNFSNYWKQSVYGDIPTEFTKIDADFEYINTSLTDFQLAVSSQNFDFIISAWIDTNYISND